MDKFQTLFGPDVDVLRESDFQVLLLANMLSPIGIGVLSPVLDSLTDPFAVTAADIGLFMSAFTLPTIFMIPVAGVLSDRLGRKPVLIAGLLMIGIGGVLIPATTDFRIALGLRVVQGMGFSGVLPIVITSLGDLYTETREATAQGFRFAGTGLANTVFPPVAGLLVVVAWQYPFALFAMAFPIAALVFVVFDEPTESADTLPDEYDGSSPDRSLRWLLGHRRVQTMVIARGFPSIAWFGFLTYNSVIVGSLIGGTPEEAGLLVAIGSATQALAATQAGRITELFANRLLLLVFANVFLGGGFAVLLFSPKLSVGMVAIAVAGVGSGLTASIYRSIITGLAPTDLRGSLVSVSESFTMVAITLTPITMGAGIAVASPVVGFEQAVRITGLAIAGVSGGGGALVLVLASLTPRVEHS